MYKIPAKTLILGKKLVFLPSCHSTNEYALEMTRSGTPIEGTVVVTDRQTDGRGQMGNKWEAAPGENLTFSIVLKPSFLEVKAQFRLTMAIALGIVDYLDTLKEGFEVKWPNDIYFSKKKMAGILIQNSLKKNRIETSIVGIGLNVNQSNFSVPAATSLLMLTDKKYSLDEMLAAILVSVEKRYLQLKFGEVDALKQAYLEKLLGYGEELLFDDGKVFQGRITNVMEDGRLEIERATGVTYYFFKEIKLV